MRITTPFHQEPIKEVDRKLIESRINTNNYQFTFKDYCNFSKIMLNAEDELVLKAANFLIQPKVADVIKYDSSQVRKEILKQKEEEVKEGKRIIGLITYSWDYRIRLQKAIQEVSQGKDPSQEFQKDIGMEHSRINDMLEELEEQRHRVQNFLKEASDMQEDNDKDIDEEINFIKLLRQILYMQMEGIKTARLKQYSKINKEPIKPQREGEQEIINIDYQNYFLRKINNRAQKMNSAEDTELESIERARKKNFRAFKYFTQNQ